MAYIRQEIHGNTPQDLMKINENTMNLWEKVHGDINFSDTDKDIQTKLLTQWVQVQGEGNFDNNYPLYVRFFIPPNVSKVTSSSFNFILEKYRMDSIVTEGGGSVVGGDISLSLASGGGGTTSVSGGGSTNYVTAWGTPPYRFPAPDSYIYPKNIDMIKPTSLDPSGGFVTSDDTRQTMGVITPDGTIKGQSTLLNYVDFFTLQHEHIIPPHNHDISIAPHSHTGIASINIPSHQHNLNPGIYVSNIDPIGTKIYINDNSVSNISDVLNNVDYTQFINIGGWNVLKITTNTLARCTIYGSVEIVIKNGK